MKLSRKNKISVNSITERSTDSIMLIVHKLSSAVLVSLEVLQYMIPCKLVDKLDGGGLSMT